MKIILFSKFDFFIVNSLYFNLLRYLTSHTNHENLKNIVFTLTKGKNNLTIII